MSEVLLECGAGVQVDSYIGPDVPGVPRTRVQVAVVDPDTGCWATVAMSLPQWGALTEGIRQIGETQWFRNRAADMKLARDQPAAPA